MQTTNEVQDRKLAHIDVRIRRVLLSVNSNGDRGALRAIMGIVARAAKPEKRAALWSHFETRIKPRLRDPMKRLHKAFDVVAAEEAAKNEEFNRFLEDARRRAG